jgi:hypothetical protein
MMPMANAVQASAPPHPSPHRERVGLFAQFFGLTAAPTAWVAQLLLNYGLASYSCFPRIAPRTTVLPGWGFVWWLLLGFNLLAVVIALAASVVSYLTWRAARHEHPGGFSHAVAAGEGRTRFFGLVGVMTGLGFLAAIIFDLVALFVVPQCIG